MIDLASAPKVLNSVKHQSHDVWLKNQWSVHNPLTLQHLMHHLVQQVDRVTSHHSIDDLKEGPTNGIIVSSSRRNVAEPPKLYGPHAPIIVPKTSDYCT